MVDPTSEVLYLLGLLYVSWHLDVQFPHLVLRFINDVQVMLPPLRRVEFGVGEELLVSLDLG
jgi:hypothetical protein